MAAQAFNWKNIIPVGFRADQPVANFLEYGSNQQLPGGKYWIQERGEYPAAYMFQRGVTQITNQELADLSDTQKGIYRDAGKTYLNVPRTEAFMGLNPSGPDDWVVVNGIQYNKKIWPNGPLNEVDSINKANNMDINDFIAILETMEGDSALPAEADMWKYFHGRVMERRNERFGGLGRQNLYFHNYFQFAPTPWWNIGYLSREAHKAEITKPFLSWNTTTNYHPGRNLAATTGVSEGVYINGYDTGKRNVVRHIYKLDGITRMGKAPATFLFGTYEWRPNNMFGYPYLQEFFPGSGNYGQWYRSNKVMLPATDLIAYGFFGMRFGTVNFEWGAGGKVTSPYMDNGWYQSDLWYKNFANTPTGQFPGPDGTTRAIDFPYYATDHNQRARYAYTPNFFQFGTNLFKDTLGPVWNGTKKLTKFKIDNGAWITPNGTYAEEMVDCWFDSRGFVDTIRDGGNMAITYYNQEGDHVERTLELEHPDDPSRTYTTKIFGSGVQTNIISL